MTRDALLALGLVLAIESQLRIADLPFGPGEACLALWIVLVLGGQGTGRERPSRAFWVMMTFWAVFIAAQSIGTVWGVATGEEYDLGLFLHDVMAYVLLAPASCLMVMNGDSAMRLRRAACSFVTFGSISLGIQFVQGLGLISIPLIDPWFWERFRGWSASPNQLALFCAVLGLLALHLAETATSRKARLAAVAALALPIVVGRMTGSDTFTLTLLATVPIFLIMKIWSWLRLPAQPRSFRIASVQLVTLTVPVFLGATIPLTMSFGSIFEGLTISLAKNNGKEAVQEADLRLSLWHQALEKGFETGMLGLGPGPHLKIPSSIVSDHTTMAAAVENVHHPPQGVAPDYEAHNTLLDVFIQGGLIAVLSLVWLQAKAFMIAYRARSAGLMALLTGVFVFGMTGLIIRHPIYWFVMGFCLIGHVQCRQSSLATVENGTLIRHSHRFAVDMDGSGKAS